MNTRRSTANCVPDRPRPSPLKAVLISAAQVQRIFVNVEGIANFHDILLADLEADQQQNKDDAAGMANTFLAHADFLKMYTQYVNGYDRCCDTVDSLKGHKKFQSLLRSARSDKACKGNNLMSFLIMPVQRIPVYTLLLERLLRAHMSRRSSAEPPATTDEPTVVDKLQQALVRVCCTLRVVRVSGLEQHAERVLSAGQNHTNRDLCQREQATGGGSLEALGSEVSAHRRLQLHADHAHEEVPSAWSHTRTRANGTSRCLG